MNLTPSVSDFLLALAARAISSGFDTDQPEPPVIGPTIGTIGNSPPEVQVQRACFVTLTTAGADLRGCCGSIEPHRSLAHDVWHNALASAFKDPRFEPLERTEFAQIRIAVSILGDLEPMPAGSEEALLRSLRPGRDGLLLKWRQRRATFLPAVWESLSEPRQFLGELKRKAGLPADFWAHDMVVHRYGTVTIYGSARDYTDATLWF